MKKEDFKILSLNQVKCTSNIQTFWEMNLEPRKKARTSNSSILAIEHSTGYTSSLKQASCVIAHPTPTLLLPHGVIGQWLFPEGVRVSE